MADRGEAPVLHWQPTEDSRIISSFNIPKSDKVLISPYNITPEYEDKGNDQQQKKLLMVLQILLVSTLGNV